MGKFSKKPKKFYLNKVIKPNNKSQAVIKPNMTGFLCTCINSENMCAKEAMSLLQEFGNKLYGPENEGIAASEKKNNSPAKNESQDSDDSDIESSLVSELEKYRNKKSENDLTLHSSNSRFQRVHINVHNSVFIATSIENPTELSLAIMNHINDSKIMRTKVLCRMIPVQKTCKAFVPDIEKAAEQLLLEHLPKTDSSFCILFSFKNNWSMKKEDLLNKIAEFASRVNPKLRVNYKTPDVVLNINVIHKICCLSLLPNYLTTYLKYNLQSIATKSYIPHTEVIKASAVALCDAEVKKEKNVATESVECDASVQPQVENIKNEV